MLFARVMAMYTGLQLFVDTVYIIAYISNFDNVITRQMRMLILCNSVICFTLICVVFSSPEEI